jgi:hypothetical protein
MGLFFTPIRVFGVWAGKILQKMKLWKRMDRILSEFNRENLDDVGPMGGDEGMAVLTDMNDLEAGHDEFVKSMAPRVDVMQ